jgi:hypothetical protein
MNKAGGLIFPYFKTYYKGTVMCHWYKDRQVGQWSRMSRIYGELIFQKGHQGYFIEKE